MAQYSDIKVSNFSQAPVQHAILDELKMKLLGWISNHKPETPESNLTPLELRGRHWINERTKSKSLFVTKADKGGAILIMNYNDVEDAVKKEIFNNDNFEKIEANAKQHIFTVQNLVNTVEINL